MHRVAAGAVELLFVGIDEIGRIDRLVLRVAVDAEHGRGHAVHVMIFQEGPRAKAVGAGGQSGIELRRLELGEGLPGVGHAVLIGLPHAGRQRGGIEFLAGIDADLGEPRPQRRFRRIGRTELQDEVEYVEKVERGAFGVGAVSGLMKLMAGAGAGAG